MAPDNFRRYIDAGILLGQVTKARAEELVRDMVDAGEVQRDQAQDWVEDVVEKSRKTTETLLTTVKQEVEAQLSLLGLGTLDDLARRVADVMRDSGAPVPQPTPVTEDPVVEARSRPQDVPTPPRAAPARRAKAAQGTATARTATKKPAARKPAGTKKSAPRKSAGTKKTPAKRAPAKAVPTTQAAKASAQKRSAAKKTPATPAGAKKATGRGGPAAARRGGRTS